MAEPKTSMGQMLKKLAMQRGGQKVYEDQAGGSYKAGNPQRIARPSVASMNPNRYRSTVQRLNKLRGK